VPKLSHQLPVLVVETETAVDEVVKAVDVTLVGTDVDDVVIVGVDVWLEVVVVVVVVDLEQDVSTIAKTTKKLKLSKTNLFFIITPYISHAHFPNISGNLVTVKKYPIGSQKPL
jgi:PII-like signaling protein